MGFQPVGTCQTDHQHDDRNAHEDHRDYLYGKSVPDDFDARPVEWSVAITGKTPQSTTPLEWYIKNEQLYSVPSSVWTPSSPLSCKFCRLRDDFDDDGQAGFGRTEGPSTARRRRNHLEVCKVQWQTWWLSMGQSVNTKRGCIGGFICTRVLIDCDKNVLVVNQRTSNRQQGHPPGLASESSQIRHCFPLRVWTVPSLCSWKFWKIQDNFNPDGQLDSITPPAPSNCPSESKLSVEFFKILMNIGMELSTLSMGHSVCRLP